MKIKMKEDLFQNRKFRRSMMKSFLGMEQKVSSDEIVTIELSERRNIWAAIVLMTGEGSEVSFPEKMYNNRCKYKGEIRVNICDFTRRMASATEEQCERIPGLAEFLDRYESLIVDLLHPVPTEEVPSSHKKNLLLVECGHHRDSPGNRIPEPNISERELNDRTLAGMRKYLDDNEASEWEIKDISGAENIADEGALTLSDRIAVSNREYDLNKDNYENILLASIHSNAGFAGDGKWTSFPHPTGIETFYFDGSELGQKLANVIQNSAVDHTGELDRGVKTNTKFAILRRTKMPSVLFENLFMNSPRDSKTLAEEGYCEGVGEAIMKGIDEAY